MIGNGSERRIGEVYAQAHHALRSGAAVILPALAEAQTGLVIVLDIAGMGNVNSRHGVRTGDRLLGVVEDSLRNQMRGTGKVARLAGDQFVVVVPGLVLPDRVVSSLVRTVVQARVRGRWGRSVSVTARLGTATWHDEASRRAAISAAGEALAKPCHKPARSHHRRTHPRPPSTVSR